MVATVGTLLGAGFNIEQTLATGVIGAGGGLMIAAVSMLVQKPKPPAEGQPSPKKLNPLITLLLIPLGLGIVFAGVVWRQTSQQPIR